MAQRGFAAAFRAIFRTRQQHQQTPHAVPPDDLSAASRYDTDGSSYDYEEIINDPPQSAAQPVPPGLPAPPNPSPPPPQDPTPVTPAAKTRVDQKVTKTPVMLRRLGLDPNNAAPAPADDASSHYSLRPRRRRKPGAPEPRGVETSRATPEAGPSRPSGPVDNSHSISLRPSRAALEDKERQDEIQPSEKPKTGPRLPAPSAATTSAIVARPDLVSVGNLEEASTATLHALCKKVGVPATGPKEQLKERVLAKLGERRFLNEDTMIMDSDGNPRALSNVPSISTPARGASATPQKREGRDTEASAHGKADGEHLTTTTVNRTPGRISGPPRTGAGQSDIPSYVRQVGEQGVTAKGGAGGIVAKSGCLGADKAVSVPFTLHLDIPHRDPNADLIGVSNGFPTLSSTGVGAPHDMPPSPAFGIHPVSSPHFLGIGIPGNSKMMDAVGDPTESVDARGGGNLGARGTGNRNVDMESVFGDLARGNRRLSLSEYEACLKALNDNYTVGANKRNVTAAALLSARGIPGTSATLPRSMPVPSQAGPRLGGQLPDATVSTPRGSFSGVGSQGASAGMRPPQIPPVPPNTPGFTSSSGQPVNAGAIPVLGKPSMPASSTVRGAAAVLRTSQAHVATEASLGKAKLPQDARTGIKMATEGNGNDSASERNLPKRSSGVKENDGSRRPQRSDLPSVKSVRENDCEVEAPIAAFAGDGQEVLSLAAQNPFPGKFSGAIGGPAAHNIVGTGRDDGKEDDLMEDIAEVDPSLELDVSLKGDQSGGRRGDSPGPEVRRDFELATPRDVVRSFNRHGADGAGTSLEVDGSGRHATTSSPSRDHVEDVRRSEESTPIHPRPPGSALPIHLRGLSAIGKLGGSSSRGHIVKDSAVHSGRIMRLPSYRARRPASTTSSGLLVNLPRSNIGKRNSYIAEKLRKQRLRGERSKNPPLSTKSLRILEELKKVREENRSHSTTKRTRSPIPVPPSVLKRARFTGQFTITAENSLTPTIQQIADTLHQIGNDLDSKRSSPVMHGAAGSRRPEPSRRLKVTPVSTKKRKPIAYGSGKKRSRPTSLSAAAMTEMESLVEKANSDRKDMAGTSKEGSAPQFAFGKPLSDVTALGEESTERHHGKASKTSPVPFAFSPPLGSSPDNAFTRYEPKKRLRTDLDSDNVPKAAYKPVASMPSASAGISPSSSAGVQQNEARVTGQSPLTYHGGQDKSASRSVGKDTFTQQEEDPGAKFDASRSSPHAPPRGITFGEGKPFKFDESNPLGGLQPSGTNIPKFGSAVQSFPTEAVSLAAFKLPGADDAPHLDTKTISSDSNDGIAAQEKVNPSLAPQEPEKALAGNGTGQPGNLLSEGSKGEATDKANSAFGAFSAPNFTATKTSDPAPPSFNFGRDTHASSALKPVDAKDGDSEKGARPEGAENAEKPISRAPLLFGATSASALAATPNKGLFRSKLNGAENEQRVEDGKSSVPKGEGASALTNATSLTAPGERKVSETQPSEPLSTSGVQPTSGFSFTAPNVGGDAQKVGEGKVASTPSLPSAVAIPADDQVASSTATVFPYSASAADRKDADDGMKASTTSPFGTFTLFGGNDASAAAASTPATGQMAGPLFGQPASTSSFAFGGASSGTASSSAQSFGGFAFGASKQEVDKDPTGPFGGPQFAPLTSTPNATTFVFGASSSQAAGATAASGGDTIGVQGSGSSQASVFGSGFQTPTGTFGSTASFSGTTQFGSGQSASALIGGAFGSASVGAFGSTSGAAFGGASGGAFGSASGGAFGTASGGAFGTASGGVLGVTASAQGGAATPFGSTQPALSAAAPLFGGSSQPGLSAPSTGSQPSFGTGIGSTGLPAFGGFGTSASTQPGGGAFGVPFGQSTPLAPGAVGGQSSGSGTAATGFSFGASNSGAASAGGAFNIGASAPQQPVRRPRRTLRGRRTLR